MWKETLYLPLPSFPLCPPFQQLFISGKKSILEGQKGVWSRGQAHSKMNSENWPETQNQGSCVSNTSKQWIRKSFSSKKSHPGLPLLLFLLLPSFYVWFLSQLRAFFLSAFCHTLGLKVAAAVGWRWAGRREVSGRLCACWVGPRGTERLICDRNPVL